MVGASELLSAAKRCSPAVELRSNCPSRRKQATFAFCGAKSRRRICRSTLRSICEGSRSPHPRWNHITSPATLSKIPQSDKAHEHWEKKTSTYKSAYLREADRPHEAVQKARQKVLVDVLYILECILFGVLCSARQFGGRATAW